MVNGEMNYYDVKMTLHLQIKPFSHLLPIPANKIINFLFCLGRVNDGMPLGFCLEGLFLVTLVMCKITVGI